MRQSGKEGTSKGDARWGEVIYQNYYLDATTYAEEVDYIRNFAVARIAWLDEQLGFVPTAMPASRQGQPATPIAIFSADGIRRSSLQPGLNIVRFSDGSTRRIWHL